MDNIITNITSEQLRAAATIKDQIAALEADLAAILGGAAAAPPAAPAGSVTGKKRGRKPGSKNKSTTDSGAPAKKSAKRKMSPEGRARIIAAQKARWAKAKAGK
ncbi:MAG: hypothetical protein R3F19_24225 [Verrucomicrobiales bacterium]